MLDKGYLTHSTGAVGFIFQGLRSNFGVGSEVPALVTAAGLADVSGCADVVDRDVVGGDETGEVEELAQVALG